MNATDSIVVSTTAEKVRRWLLGKDVVVYIKETTNYPVWYWAVSAISISFCFLSWTVWFCCATYRLREERPCNHVVYEAHIYAQADKNPDEKVAQKSEKSQKHSKKLEALNEAESLVKSFRGSRKSMKSSKSSRKSSKKSSKKSKEDANDDEGKEARNEGGRCAIEMGVVDTDVENEAAAAKSGFFKTLASGMFFSRDL